MNYDRQATTVSVATTASMRSIIRRIDELPILPAVALQALTLSLQDDTDISKLAQVMESDPVLTARILKLVNNAQSGLRHRVGTVKQAVTLAGLTQVRFALLGVLVKDYLPQAAPQILAASKALWTHSLITAILAALLAKKTYPELKDTAFVGGLLHDIGKVVIMDVFPDIFHKIIEIQADKQLSSMEAEQKILDTNHCLVGKVLAQQWNLPDALTDCIWLHHHHFDFSGMSSLNWEISSIVNLANILARDIFCEAARQGDFNDSVKSLCSMLSLDLDELTALRREATREYENTAAFFDLETDLNIVFHEVLQNANRKLSQMGMDLDARNRSLSRMNDFLMLSRRLGLGLGSVRNRQELLHEVAQAFSGFSFVPVGIFYTIDFETHELEGIVWIEGGRRRKLLCFTDRNGDPVWEHDDQSLPADLRKVLANHKLRIHPAQAIAQNVSAPFLIFSFGEKKCYFAELCISLHPDFHALDEQQGADFLQIAHLIRSSLENLLLFERFQKKQEDLSLALWKNQQVNVQLIQAERLAAVGQLAAGAAHEINNPLAIISARAQLLELKEQDEKRKRELALISEQIDRISKILSNLMDFARPAPPKLQAVDIHAVLNRVLELISNGYRKHNITIRKQYDPHMIQIKADCNQLEQVFLNLAINAQHAMEHSGGTLTVATRVVQEGRMILVDIQDQGVGISRENLKKIFDPFFTTKEEGKGTGLGLSTSMGIINNHFGKIDIESTVGKGTTFTVELPVDITALRPYSDNPDTTCRLSRSARPRILVVDDEEHIRDILREALENEDMSVETASNGQEGLDRLSREHFDLLLLDIKMPFRDGLSLLRQIRQKGSAVPVIVVTGMASHAEMEEAKKHGSKCIRKPFHIKGLLAEVRDSLRIGNA